MTEYENPKRVTAYDSIQFAQSRTTNTGVIGNRSKVSQFGNSMDVKVEQGEKLRLLKPAKDKARIVLINSQNGRANPNGSVDFSSGVQAVVIDASEETVKALGSRYEDRLKLPSATDSEDLPFGS